MLRLENEGGSLGDGNKRLRLLEASLLICVSLCMRRETGNKSILFSCMYPQEVNDHIKAYTDADLKASVTA